MAFRTRTDPTRASAAIGPAALRGAPQPRAATRSAVGGDQRSESDAGRGIEGVPTCFDPLSGSKHEKGSGLVRYFQPLQGFSAVRRAGFERIAPVRVARAGAWGYRRQLDADVKDGGTRQALCRARPSEEAGTWPAAGETVGSRRGLDGARAARPGPRRHARRHDAGRHRAQPARRHRTAPPGRSRGRAGGRARRPGRVIEVEPGADLPGAGGRARPAGRCRRAGGPSAAPPDGEPA
jgi:hypothetical protein